MSAVGIVRAYARRVTLGRQDDTGVFCTWAIHKKGSPCISCLFLVRGSVKGTVSRIAGSLDASVAAFHRRHIRKKYRFLLFDGVVLKRKTGGGSAKRVVLVALWDHL